MDVIEAIKQRKSIRGYKPEAVPKEVLEEILRVATRAPSGMNTQPWEITVIAGEVMEQIKMGNLVKFGAGERPQREVVRGQYEGIFRERQVALAVQLFQLMGIAREDRQKRVDWMQRGFRFFDAPAAIILSMDKSVGPGGQFDIGALCQTIALAALNHGLGTCIMDQGVMYQDVTRKFTGIPEDKSIVICMTIGYPDWDFPANRINSDREPVESITNWLGV